MIGLEIRQPLDLLQYRLNPFDKYEKKHFVIFELVIAFYIINAFIMKVVSKKNITLKHNDYYL